jgi:hypothetical protein
MAELKQATTTEIVSLLSPGVRIKHRQAQAGELRRSLSNGTNEGTQVSAQYPCDSTARSIMQPVPSTSRYGAKQELKSRLRRTISIALRLRNGSNRFCGPAVGFRRCGTVGVRWYREHTGSAVKRQRSQDTSLLSHMFRHTPHFLKSTFSGVRKDMPAGCCGAGATGCAASGK